MIFSANYIIVTHSDILFCEKITQPSFPRQRQYPALEKIALDIAEFDYKTFFDALYASARERRSLSASQLFALCGSAFWTGNPVIHSTHPFPSRRRAIWASQRGVVVLSGIAAIRLRSEKLGQNYHLSDDWAH
ncbi:hypothetical protein Hypma_004872 [Hypsizygus marmoreus]|uniref:Uncharacterized protein n=1 Tax=Hypsizygus marmoreus TaxID=39966 RepID=A0A369IZH6_HYPMA|nr:hypothetical protein Hypma_004872 [Hypsizygus marmoreus]